MNPADIKEQLKKLEVFAGGRSVYDWEPVTVGDYPHVIVVSKADTLLWGHEILQAIVDSQVTAKVEKLVSADRVVAEWMDGRIEVMTDDETRTFSSREDWRQYWSALDDWPGEIDTEGAK